MKSISRTIVATSVLLAALGWFGTQFGLSGTVAAAGRVYEIQVAGTAGVPADAVAVAVNLTVDNVTAPGFLTAYPCGTTQPVTSNANYDTGAPSSNSAIVKVGANGKICIYAHTKTDLIVDITGSFPATSDYQTVAPSNRLIDTRTTTARPAGSTYELQVAGTTGVPANTAAVAINLAVDNVTAPGFLTAYPCGTTQPVTSNANYDTGAPSSNSAIVKVGANGKICIYTHTKTDLIVDITGSFPATSDYQTVAPSNRLIDTRTTTARPAGSTYELQVAGTTGVPANTAAVAINLAVDNVTAPGFLTAYPCGTTQPVTSNANYDTGAPSSNSAIVKVGANGKICIYTHTKTDLIVDITGSFPATSDYQTVAPSNRLIDTRPPPPPAPAAPNVSGAAFAATFDANTGLDKFNTGLWHRDNTLVGNTTWTGDHDTNCGSPDTQRTIHRDNPAESFYMCKDHLMTSVGDTSGYSIAWFSPKQTFNGQRTVSFDVNSTDLGNRQWWEVALVPANYRGPQAGCPQCTSTHTAVQGFLESAVPGTIVLGTDGGGGRPQLNYQDLTRDHLCRTAGGPLDPEACASKAIRRTWTITDNANGTITVSYLNNSWTTNGSFPTANWNLVLKDHNYTPDKDGPVIGHTWHWDNIIVR